MARDAIHLEPPLHLLVLLLTLVLVFVLSSSVADVVIGSTCKYLLVNRKKKTHLRLRQHLSG